MNTQTNKPFAEIIESSLHSFKAQTWQWNQFPTFGALMAIQSKKRTILGIVHHIQTGSIDPSRSPFPYQKTQEELMAEQPQIFEFLQTSFTCQTLGYSQNGQIYYLLAPEPPAIHAFVAPAQNELSRQFFASTAYLHLLFGFASQIGNLDELLLALLQQHKILKITSKTAISGFIDTFSLLTGNDYRRLKLFLQRAEQILT